MMTKTRKTEKKRESGVGLAAGPAVHAKSPMNFFAETAYNVLSVIEFSKENVGFGNLKLSATPFAIAGSLEACALGM